MSLPVVSNALTKAGTLAAVVVVLAVVEAGLSLAYTGDIGAPIVALLGIILKNKSTLGPHNQDKNKINTPIECIILLYSQGLNFTCKTTNVKL